MFTSKKDFIQAMLNGRNFINSHGSKCYWDGENFIRNSNIWGGFTDYNSVTEILPKPEPFDPEPGDRILVWGQDENMAGERIFMQMVDGWYVCQYEDSSGYPEVFPYAKVLEETKWFRHDGRSWPGCRPDDEIEGKDRLGHARIDRADWFVWSWDNEPHDTKDIIAWRPIK